MCLSYEIDSFHQNHLCYVSCIKMLLFPWILAHSKCLLNELECGSINENRISFVNEHWLVYCHYAIVNISTWNMHRCLLKAIFEVCATSNLIEGPSFEMLPQQNIFNDIFWNGNKLYINMICTSRPADIYTSKSSVLSIFSVGFVSATHTMFWVLIGISFFSSWISVDKSKCVHFPYFLFKWNYMSDQ